MGLSPIVGTLEFAKVAMSIFIMAYAYFFLRRTESYYERKPWEYLYIAALCLFAIQVIGTLQLFNADAFKHELVMNLKSFVEFAFLGFFLFSFIFQHNMLLKRGKIMLEEKPTRTTWDSMKNAAKFYSKKYGHDDDETPEQGMEKELSAMDTDSELKREEEQIEEALKGAEQKSQEESDMLGNAQKLIMEVEQTLRLSGHDIDADKAEILNNDLDELRRMLRADHKDLDRIENKMKEILHDKL
ncbi:hypothetical protein ACFL1B_03620 [Nanoarchaeota archaeon]